MKVIEIFLSFRNAKVQSGVNVEKLEKVGKIEVKFAGVQELLQFHIYLSDSYSGDLKESRGNVYNVSK